LSPCRNAAKRSAQRAEVSLPRNPITGIAVCCARAMPGSKAQVPPSSETNSRRCILPPRASIALHIRATSRKRRGVWPVCCDPMSATGQSRRSDRAPFTSGLPRLADILVVSRHVSNVPNAEVVPRAELTSESGRAALLRLKNAQKALQKRGACA
jgi:hypothetical protein